jgi:hypothetical protein
MLSRGSYRTAGKRLVLNRMFSVAQNLDNKNAGKKGLVGSKQE